MLNFFSKGYFNRILSLLFLGITACEGNYSKDKVNQPFSRDTKHELSLIQYIESINLLKFFNLRAYKGFSDSIYSLWHLNFVMAQLISGGKFNFILTGQNGTYDPRLRTLLLENHIVAILPDETLFFSDRAICNLEDQVIYVDVPVEFKNYKLGRLKADRLEYHWDQQYVAFMGNVRSLLRIKDMDYLMESEEVFWYGSKNQAIFQGNFILSTQRWKAQSQTGTMTFFEGSKYPQLIDLKGASVITLGNVQIESEFVQFDVFKQFLNLKGKTRVIYEDKAVHSDNVEVDLVSGYLSFQDGQFEGF